MKNVKFLSLVGLTLFFLACSKEKVEPVKTSDPKEVETDSDLKPYLRENPQVGESLNFVVSYTHDTKPEHGYLITAEGQILSYAFDKQHSDYLKPGNYDGIASYFDNANVKPVGSVNGSWVEQADNLGLSLMNEYDNLVNESIRSEGAKGLGTCNIYQVQRSDPEAEELSFFPMRLLEGTYNNTWYVKNSEIPLDLLEQIDLVLNEAGGLMPEYWEHYNLK